MEKKLGFELTVTHIQIIFSTYVLADKSPANNVMRRILFGNPNTDWKVAYDVAVLEMPELKNATMLRNILNNHKILAKYDGYVDEAARRKVEDETIQQFRVL